MPGSGSASPEVPQTSPAGSNLVKKTGGAHRGQAAKPKKKEFKLVPGLGLVDRSPSASPAASVVGAAIYTDQPPMVAPSPLAASTSNRPRPRAYQQSSVVGTSNVIRASPALNAQLNTTRMTAVGVTPSRLLTFESPVGPSVPLGRSSERPITSTPRAAAAHSGLIRSGTFTDLEDRADLDSSRPIIELDASPLGSPPPAALSPSAQTYSPLVFELSSSSQNQTMTSPPPSGGTGVGDSPMSKSGIEAFFNSTQRRYDDESPSSSPIFG